MKLLKLILILAILLAVLSFSVLNRETSVLLNYWIGEQQISLVVLMLCCVVSGWLIGVLSLSGPMLKMRLKQARLKREVKTAETEVQNLRQLPLDPDY